MFSESFFAVSEVAHEVTLWILVIISILSVTFILERWVFLHKVSRNTRDVIFRIREILQSHNLDEIEEISRKRESIEGNALNHGLKYAKKNGFQGLEEVLNSYFLMEKSKLERFLNFLATVGSNAPFIGLLGTVFGVMDAFRELASQQGDASAVMLGVSKALVATAVGLLVALPAIVAYNAFQKQIRNILQSFESVRDLCLAYAKTVYAKTAIPSSDESSKEIR